MQDFRLLLLPPLFKWCVSSLIGLESGGTYVSALFQSVQKLPVAVCQERAVNYLFAQSDQQAEQQCQGAPARSSVCRVSCGVQWTLTDLECASAKEQIAHTPLQENKKYNCVLISESPECTCAFVKSTSKAMKRLNKNH